MKKGKLFVLEGLDGCGKTTVINHLKKVFPRAVFTREPGGSVFGEKIRTVLLDPDSKTENPMTNFLTFWSARSSHFDKIILPAINNGQNVFCDRLDASTYAFQICAGKNRSLSELFFKLRAGIFKVKPIYIYLNIPVSVSVARMAGRKDKNHFDARGKKYHEDVKRGYDKFFKLEQIKNNVENIDATNNEEKVIAEVLKRVSKYI